MPTQFTGQQTSNPNAGMYQNITQITGSDENVSAVSSALATANAVSAGLKEIAGVLPPSEIKDWLSKSPKQMIADLIKIIVGKKYTTGDYILGERLNDQILGNPNISRQQVTDEMVDLAHSVFNQLFGVRITTSDDLDALDQGVAAYKAREAAKGISDNAINRAVFLKQNFYPSSTYNNLVWDLKYFGLYPLVDKIPGYTPGSLYSGKVVGGSTAINGVIQLDADSLMKQVSGAQYSATGGLLNQGMIAGISTATIQKYAPFIAILIVLGVIFSIKSGIFKP
jgi:hypothetical protein